MEVRNISIKDIIPYDRNTKKNRLQITNIAFIDKHNNN